MLLEKRPLIAVTLMLLAGCSASRHALESEGDYDSPESVPMPMRHTDEYDSRDYDSERVPSDDKSFYPPQPVVPMGEPVPAPPAIGVSRVKSVSWFRNVVSKSTRNTCGDTVCADSCGVGQSSQLPPEYFTEGCITPSQTGLAPDTRCREKTTLMEAMQGWHLPWPTRRTKSTCRPGDCGERKGCDSGGCTSGGCAKDHNSRRIIAPPTGSAGRTVGEEFLPAGSDHRKNRGGSLADPLKENGLDDLAYADDPRFSPDELLDLASVSERPIHTQRTGNVSGLPSADSVPLRPTPAQSFPPANQNPAPWPALPQPGNQDTSKRTVQPSNWPRLGHQANNSVSPPVTAPSPAAVVAPTEDLSLPIIQPRHSI